MKINSHERKVLRFLAGNYSPYDGCHYGFKWIMRATRLPRAAVRRACRSLARKGLADFARGLWDDDGRPAGSGYSATKAGVELMGSK